MTCSWKCFSLKLVKVTSLKNKKQQAECFVHCSLLMLRSEERRRIRYCQGSANVANPGVTVESITGAIKSFFTFADSSCHSHMQ